MKVAQLIEALGAVDQEQDVRLYVETDEHHYQTAVVSVAPSKTAARLFLCNVIDVDYPNGVQVEHYVSSEAVYIFGCCR